MRRRFVPRMGYQRVARRWDPSRGPEEQPSYRWCRKIRSTTGYRRRSLPGSKTAALSLMLALMGRWPVLLFNPHVVERAVDEDEHHGEEDRRQAASQRHALLRGERYGQLHRQ